MSAAPAFNDRIWRRPPWGVVALVLAAHAMLLTSAPRRTPRPASTASTAAKPQPVWTRSVVVAAAAAPAGTAPAIPPPSPLARPAPAPAPIAPRTPAPVQAAATRPVVQHEARPAAVVKRQVSDRTAPDAGVSPAAHARARSIAADRMRTVSSTASILGAGDAADHAAASEAVSSPGPEAATAARPSATASAALADASGTPSLPAPVRIAGPAMLEYTVSGQARGLRFEADATLRWQPGATRYAAEWTVNLPLVGARTQRSEGLIGAFGLAPARYAEKARGERAAHFDAEGGRIRFSANTPDAALQPGAQDRLSAALQLGALISAAPERYPPGSVIPMQTAGVREADVWSWDVLADETLQIDGQPMPCARLVRQPRRDYDTRVEIWLAREREHLPARLKVTQSNGDVADQQLNRLPAAR